VKDEANPEDTGYYPEVDGHDLMVEHEESAFHLMNGDPIHSKVIIDSGATSSVGSLQAMEALAQRLAPGALSIDITRRPRFKFGNGTKGSALSSAVLKLQDGTSVTIAVIDTEPSFVPILAGMTFLRDIKASINFNDATMTSKLSTRPVQLERLSSGHLALDIVQLLSTG
jgi:hypothetical protein